MSAFGCAFGALYSSASVRQKIYRKPGFGRSKKKRTDARNGSVLLRLNTTGLLCGGVLLSMNTN